MSQRGLGLIVMIIGLVACSGSSTHAGERLAPDQTLRFSIQDDVQTLDPGQADSSVDITFIQEIFSGLYRFDDQLKIVPDLASGMPEISADGKTYTVKLRQDARFWNGGSITAKDILYSWNRAAYMNGSYASVFDPVEGASEVRANKTKSMRGLSAPDDFTVVAQLSEPAGYWLSELALWTADVVDHRVVGDYADPNNKSNDAWWTDPATAIGSGPFRLTQRTPKASLEFKPVAHWYEGSTGALTQVRVDIGVDPSSAIKKLETGAYTLMGIGGTGAVAPDDVLRYRADPSKRKLLTIYPLGFTNWLGYNFTAGSFQGRDTGREGRLAISKAIDRSQLVDIACVKGATCTAATGGFISKGLKGYLGDNADETTNFDAARAKATLAKWDPTGSRLKGLKLSYNSSPATERMFGNVQSQLQANLGISVELDPSDFPTLANKRKAGETVFFRDAWGADYDHPQDWFDNLWSCSQAVYGRGNNARYCNPDVDRLAQKARTEPIAQAESEYKQAQRLMIRDVYGAALTYGTRTYIVQPYLKGAGANSLYDYSWLGIRIIEH